MKSFLILLLACETAFCADYLPAGQAARLVIGQKNFTAQFVETSTTTGDPIATATQLGGVGGVAYANNRLFVADGNTIGGAPVYNRVLIYTPVSGFPTPTGYSQAPTYSSTCSACINEPALVVGQPDFTTGTEALTQAGLRTPTGIASDGTHLVIADTDNNRILIWNSIPSTDGQPADVVLGQADFTHGAGAMSPSATTLRGPEGVWISNGKLFVADTIDDRVLIYNSIPTTNNAAADVVVGAPDFTTLVQPPVTKQVVPATQTNLSSPTSVTSDGTHLFITDLGHHRVLIWNAIPTNNNAPADVVIGQLNFTSQTSNDSTNLCPSNGTDTSTTPATPTYPALCGKTLSFPRFTLSDGQRLYIADGGNDRVLVYDSIPTVNTPEADVILGQPDENTDNSSADSDAMSTPTGLAWDGTNLYVADTFNLRVLVFTPLGVQLPLTAVRNGASLSIYATGDVFFTGTPAAKDTVTIEIGTTNYTYTVQTNDTLANVATGLTALINGTASGSTADPNLIAVADTVNPGVILTARVAGSGGEGTALNATVSSTSAIVATASGTSITIDLASAVEIAPGSLISVFGTGLSTQSAAFDYATKSAPKMLAGTNLYIDGLAAPLLYVSPYQINAQMPFYVNDRSSVSITVVSTDASGNRTATNSIGTVIVPENPGLFANYGTDPRPGFVNHLTNYSSGLVSVDGTITAGDTVSIIVGSNTYTYTVLSTDTLASVRDALVKLMANDPSVYAVATNTFTRVYLRAKVAGTAGNAITYSQNTNTGATEILTAFAANLCCGNSGNAQVTTANPAEPGEVVYTYATGLGITNSTPEATTTMEGPDSVSGVLTSSDPSQLFPPQTPVDSILAGGKSAEVIDVTLVPGTIGLYQVTFLLPTGLPDDNLTQLTIAQYLYVSNVVTFAVATPTS